MTELNNQEIVNKEQTVDYEKSPLASALFRHLRDYYNYKNPQDIINMGFKIIEQDSSDIR